MMLCSRPIRIQTTQRLPQVAFKSTSAAAASKCPFTGEPSAAPADVNGKVQLKKIRSLPFVGSMWSWYSGTPQMVGGNPYKVWPTLRKEFGDFYCIGIPGLGEGVRGDTLIIQDPAEMMKLVRREGKYPHSIVERQWALKEVFETEANFGRVNYLFSSGENW
jgi:hypothetical protein